MVIHPKSDISIKNLHPSRKDIEKDNFVWSDNQQNTPWDASHATNFCASLFVSPLISDNMILQRGSPDADIFGWSRYLIAPVSYS